MLKNSRANRTRPKKHEIASATIKEAERIFNYNEMPLNKVMPERRCAPVFFWKRALPMSKIVEVRIPKFPECWESCGNCGSGEVIIDDVLVLPGDMVEREDNLIVLETGKVALDIPAPTAGRVASNVFIAG